MDFLKFPEKKKTFYFNLLIFCLLIWMLRSYLWSQSFHNIKFPTSLLRPKTNIVTTLSFRRRFSDQVSILQQSRDFEIVILTKI